MLESICTKVGQRVEGKKRCGKCFRKRYRTGTYPVDARLPHLDDACNRKSEIGVRRISDFRLQIPALGWPVGMAQDFRFSMTDPGPGVVSGGIGKRIRGAQDGDAKGADAPHIAKLSQKRNFEYSTQLIVFMKCLA